MRLKSTLTHIALRASPRPCLTDCLGPFASPARPIPDRRFHLHATTAALALALLSPAIEPARAGCTESPAGTETCSGTAVPSANFANPPTDITTLNVNSLAGNIAPGAGTMGISLTAAGPDGSGASGGDPTNSGAAQSGTPGPNIIIQFTDPSHSVTTSGAAGVLGTSTGGRGGDGQDPFHGPAAGGASGGSVTITTQGPINTDAASGIFAGSQGGNGGNGDTGASGAGAGNGGDLTVTAQGAVTTTSANAPGIVALSTGGTGGNGGSGFIINPGDGAAGGFGGHVIVTTSGAIQTAGDSSAGVIARSIGGGGGNGGDGFAFSSSTGGGAASGGHVEVHSSSPTIMTGGNNSAGIFAQSVGGFAGSGGFNTLIFTGSGGNGNSGGNGGEVDVTTAAGNTITTIGVNSPTIYAQSVGGGGGSGGTGFGLFYASGGAGSVGGSGGFVKVTNFATLNASGDQSSGIFAQSIGGGGGSGGAAGSAGGSFGGGGGVGNAGGTVEVHNHGVITVSGNGSFQNVKTGTLAAGIFAQSVGGGGGDGGLSGSIGILSFGGNGGTGGTGGDVTVENTNTIQVQKGPSGTGGPAIFAQSIGGGGGNGGGSIGVITLGGTGGSGNHAGMVEVDNSGTLTTTSTFSAGIFAQSVGGGGGNGAFAGGIAAIGGTGGTGGDGQSVTVNSSKDITTGGSDSQGILAQSIGGGGGNGGGSVGVGLFASFALGGKGASGGNGGNVCVNTNGAGCSNSLASGPTTITTTGDRSTGILAQSIGGGGGNGGFAVSASVGLYGDVSIGVGGMGSNGGTGGDVHVSSGGQPMTITTGTNSGSGQFSDGIDAESIGGGGGNGGFSVAAGASTGGAVSASFGGNGGAGNHSGKVFVNTQASVTTNGDQAVGIFARSIGGGGGNGGWAVSVGGSPYASLALSFGGKGGGGGPADEVHVDNVGTIHTFGAQSNGISAQSIGGGGGNGGFSVSVAVSINSAGGAASLGFGGEGGTGGTGALVHVSNQGDITTEGVGSVGILAQSIGGGGGNGGFSGAISATAGAAFSDALGGKGGSGNRAGPVDVTETGNITTKKDNASGIVAQSIGGGGGNGAFSISVAASLNSFAIGKAAAGDGGDSGIADKVTVTSNGTIQTQGSLSYGILAQSIGGGGGNGGFAVGGAFSESAGATGNSVGGSGGSGNTAGDVTVTTNLAAGMAIPGTVISTTGTGAIGILAQSIGGGGGNGGFAANINASISDNAGDNTLGATGALGGGGGAGSDGHTVTVNNNGKIVTTGAAAHGIVAQSIGGGGGNGGFAISGSFSEEANASSNALGGQGGNGGAGGLVTVNNKGDIDVGGLGGNTANGIIAQSIGGGGGNGGFSIGAALSLGGKAANNTVGGSGGAGGASGEVDVFNFNAITVRGAHSIGILAQSIGGGGGNGGFTVGAAAAINGSDGASDAVGGSGGNGGQGGVVKVTTFSGSSITTMAAMSNGIQAQSIGGGGGNGGFSITGSFSTDGDAKSTVGGSCDTNCQSSATGGGGGKANQVTVDNAGSIDTKAFNSIGILAQSIGGGGGSGGFAISAGISLNGAAASNSVGGNGGNGGDGDKVVVTNEATGVIHTEQANSIGISAQSIGGGGGNGGFAIAGTFSDSSKAATNTVGGSGGNGGAGGEVDVFNHNVVQVDATHSIGILAQSIGGGGGNGGFAIGAGITTSDSAGAADTVGGSGGNGGAGGVVKVTNFAGSSVTTTGFMDFGIVAQSIGGGGGNGGFTLSGSFSASGDASTNVGGSCNAACVAHSTGGGGGAGQDVTVDNFGGVTTNSAASTGIVAQSIGGGGGNGGFAGALVISGGGNTASNAVGGSGGNGGASGTVTVINESTGNIHTFGANSIGILAQSIGGGGGSGGFAISASGGSGSGDSTTIGGSGGSGGNGGKVNVTNFGTITTEQVLSTGIVAQSIGGGGGNGAFSINGTLSTGSGGSTSTVGGTGGHGGAAGNADDVTVTENGTITVKQAGSVGILAQSIGGGGGNGGFSGGLSVSGGALSNNVGGGAGGGGGTGGNVKVVGTGSVIASGDNSVAVIAQSIGGGGGNGGFSISAAAGGSSDPSLNIGGASSGTNGAIGTVTVDISGGVLTTGGALAYGLLTQGIGGGGGNGGMAVIGSLAVGAAGLIDKVGGSDPGSNGTTAKVTNSNAITTTGVGASGLVVQSIGGGGGTGAFVATAGVTGGSTNITVGGLGGGGGDGMDATVKSLASITTTNIGALGLIAQSIGGGGGVAEVVGASGGGTVTLGAANSASGNAGAVNVTSTGAIGTSHDAAHGILAQSIGGGGGFALTLAAGGSLLNLPVSAGAAGGGGNGGHVTVTSSAGITTTGAGAFGIIAQSVGGGGGVVGGGVFATSLGTGPFAGTVGGAGSGGLVDVTTSANISTTGQDATSIFAQSVGGSGASNITVNVQSGVVTGGAGSGHAVSIDGGFNNTLTNSGTLTTVAGVNGMTITGGSGAESAINNSLINGSVNLDGGANAFDNKPTGTFNSGVTVFLGTGNLLTNEGLMSPGAYVNVLATNVTGNFLQTATGTYGLDLEFLNQTSDRINITGTASVTGTVNINIMDPGLALPGSHSTTILSAAGDVTNHAGLTLTFVPTAVAQYMLAYPDPKDIVLDYSINFSPAGLTTNEHSVGNAINQIQTARNSPNFVPIAAALFYQPTVAALGRVYDSLSGEGTSGVEQTAFAANDLFMTAAARQAALWLWDKSDDSTGVTLHGDGAMYYAPSGPQNPAFAVLKAPPYHPRTWRLWAQAYGSGGSIAGEFPLGSARLNYAGGGLAAGADYQVNPDALVGFALGGGPSWFRVPDRSTSGTVDAGHLAAYGAARHGPWYLTGIVGYDFFENEEHRFASIPGTNAPIVPVPGFAESLTGKFFSQSVSARLETGWRVAFDNVHVTPFVALQYGLLDLNSFTETASTGPSVIGLSYANRLVDTLPLFVGTQFDGKFIMPGETAVTVWLRLSWMHEFEPFRTIDSSFIAAPGFDFIINGAIAPRDAARVDAGWKFAVTQNTALFANFDGEFSGKGDIYGGTGGLRVSW